MEPSVTNPTPLPWGAFGERLARLGQMVVQGVEEIGFGMGLFLEALFFTFVGPFFAQPVRLRTVVDEMMEIGIRALPIVTLLSTTIGIMLAIQGIYSLRMFGAETKVVYGVALSVVREFAPLITGILVAGRSGSAFAARLASMTLNQEVDALRVMAINPVRFLVAPALIAMVVMLPCLTFFSEVTGILASAFYVQAVLGMSLSAFLDQTFQILSLGDFTHGLGKSLLFSILITLVGTVNGASIQGGADEVGRMTTRAVVHSITAIILTDMLFAFILTRK